MAKRRVVKIEETKTEKVPLAIIYKDEGSINIDYTTETKNFEIFGFLKCLVDKMQEDLTSELEEK